MLGSIPQFRLGIIPDRETREMRIRENIAKELKLSKQEARDIGL